MKIIQITDIHVGGEDDDTCGVDVRANFLKILKEAKFRKPDRLVLTGDLCFNIPQKEIYYWVKEKLDNLQIPYDVICGNHDNSTMVAEVFEKTDCLHEKELFFQKRLGHKSCFFLDTAIGELSNNQLNWIEKNLNELNEDVVIFMHHPPVNSGAVFMEKKHAMRKREQLHSVLFKFKHSITIFCGHYHIEKTICQQNTTVHISPSTYVQIDDNAPSFRIDHHRIALREITFSPDAVLSSVRYFNGKKL